MSILAIALASVAQFALGFVWYGLIFGKLWGKIHGHDQLSAEEQKAMMSKVGPYYAMQFVVTVITTVVLALLINHVQGYSAYALAALVWLGFVVPTQVADVIFGNTPPRWMLCKMAILAGGSLVFLMAAAGVLSVV
ncbi:MAG: DUF1761 domain-containing protein [Formosimonas sp.]